MCVQVNCCSFRHTITSSTCKLPMGWNYTQCIQFLYANISIAKRVSFVQNVKMILYLELYHVDPYDILYVCMYSIIFIAVCLTRFVIVTRFTCVH